MMDFRWISGGVFVVVDESEGRVGFAFFSQTKALAFDVRIGAMQEAIKRHWP
jgi:hypothetical protein